MLWRMKSFVLILALVLLSACGESTYIEPTPAEAVFLTNCVACHRGPGNPPGPTPQILQSLQTNNLDKFRAFLRKPTSSMMPSFSESQLSNEDIDLLYQYLQELKSQ